MAVDELLEQATVAFRDAYRSSFPAGGDAEDHDEAVRAGVGAVLELQAGWHAGWTAQVFADEEGGWRWHVRAGNGEIVSVGEAHTRSSDARRAVELAFPDVPVTPASERTDAP